MSTVVDPDTNEHEAAAVAEPAVDTTHHEASPTCPNCGAPADRGQLMCLECGSRLALDYQRPPSWRLPAAVVAVVLLIAGVAAAIGLAAASGGGSASSAGTPPQPAAATPQNPPADTPPTASTPTPAPPTATTPSGGSGGTASTPTAAPTASMGWPPGKSAFTVILASMPSEAAAEAKLKDAQAAGIGGAAVLHSDDFPSLNPGYWVVFDGQYDSIDQAKGQAAADRGKGGFTDAYPRFVSKDANAKP